MTDLVLYETSERVATITLNRPEAANAQNSALLNALNDAWETAAADDEVRVIVLQANGRHFSAGHDLRSKESVPEKFTLQYMYEREARQFLGYSLAWRNVPKPSIAAVQGACIAGGLLLCWPCDLIVAADDAKFSDPVVAMGIGGVEYHGHTWEMGPRKAKELLFTRRSMSALEAEQVGMVNKVVPEAELRAYVRALAVDIATQDAFALRQAKRAVNQTLDVQGFYAAVQSVFDVHQTGHGHALSVAGYPILMGLDDMKTEIEGRERATITQ